MSLLDISLRDIFSIIVFKMYLGIYSVYRGEDKCIDYVNRLVSAIRIKYRRPVEVIEKELREACRVDVDGIEKQLMDFLREVEEF